MTAFTARGEEKSPSTHARPRVQYDISPNKNVPCPILNWLDYKHIKNYNTNLFIISNFIVFKHSRNHGAKYPLIFQYAAPPKVLTNSVFGPPSFLQ